MVVEIHRNCSHWWKPRGPLQSRLKSKFCLSVCLSDKKVFLFLNLVSSFAFFLYYTSSKFTKFTKFKSQKICLVYVKSVSFVVLQTARPELSLSIPKKRRPEDSSSRLRCSCSKNRFRSIGLIGCNFVRIPWHLTITPDSVPRRKQTQADRSESESVRFEKLKETKKNSNWASNRSWTPADNGPPRTRPSGAPL